MRLGLISDIHEAIIPLRAALAHFRRVGVDEILDLGDVCRMTTQLRETVEILRAENIIGTWGNHDFGLCLHPEPELAQRYSPEFVAYFARYHPFLTRADCRFCHIPHYLDATELADLWNMDPVPDSPEKLARSFDAVPQRVLFSGHVHRWFLATPAGSVEWNGSTPVRLDPAQRWYVTLNALCDGSAALYDTETAWLTPLNGLDA